MRLTGDSLNVFLLSDRLWVFFVCHVDIQLDDFRSNRSLLFVHLLPLLMTLRPLRIASQIVGQALVHIFLFLQIVQL